MHSAAFAAGFSGVMASGEMPPVSIRNGVRIVSDPGVTVEQVLLAVGDQIGHSNLSFASRMNKAIVVFLKEERFVRQLIESGIVLNDLFVQVSPLAVPSIKITISGVPPFIPNTMLESELRRFGKFASGFRNVSLGCKDPKLSHVQSLRRQVYMFLDSPTQSLDVSFRVKYEGGYYMVYASSNTKCFECGDVGHKRFACPHKKQEEQAAADRSDVNSQANTEVKTGEQAVNEAAVEPNINEGQDEAVDDASSTVEKEDQQGSSADKDGESASASTSLHDSQLLSDGGDMEYESASEVASEVGECSRGGDIYTLEEMISFLDVTYGKPVTITDHFEDTEKFISSVSVLLRTHGLEVLDEKKRYRLKKHVTALRKAARLNKNKNMRKGKSRKL